MNSYACQRGFTLIELIVVLSILAILSTLGIAAFINYSRIQALNAAASDFETTLKTAKSRAQSQVKPASCAGQSLDGYAVAICTTGSPCLRTEYNYELHAVCGGNRYFIEGKRIASSNISLRVDFSVNSFTFSVLTGGVNFGGSSLSGLRIVRVTFTGYEVRKRIAIYNDGRIAPF